MVQQAGHRETHRVPIESSLAGILALLIEDRERRLADDKTAVKTEVLLTGVGVTVDDLVVLTGKKADTIRKTIQRGKAK